ncbi:hypothetical protein [Synechococcus sp. PCC 7336]|uniref:hypothetical protein n=1 Tax=Synechococcus sp. PCC 7336 TaxID=195250 RepID=UPI0003457B38|nr:hypothetical protein [Synechococcus sp. PCC 7336]
MPWYEWKREKGGPCTTSSATLVLKLSHYRSLTGGSRELYFDLSDCWSELHILQINAIPEGEKYRKFLATLKQAIDPNGILAPGRYIAEP